MFLKENVYFVYEVLKYEAKYILYSIYPYGNCKQLSDILGHLKF